MTTSKSVLGVSGVCRVAFGYPTRIVGRIFEALRGLCWVCWVCVRVRACVTLFADRQPGLNISYARTIKPNKPNTPNTELLKVLNLKGFKCVGFVLGCGFFVSGSNFRGMAR